MHTVISPRKPLLAAAMSLILPGFGQLYNGEVNKAIWLFLIFAFLTLPAMAFLALYLPAGWMMPALVISLAASLAVWIYGIADAWRTAAGMTSYVARSWQASGAYMLVLILCNLIGFPLVINYVRNHQVAPYRVPSTSMEPGILQGDYFFADKRYNCPGCKQEVKRGDIALFAYPNNRTLLYIKRIIGLPGDHVQIRGTEISVNGKPLTMRTTHENGEILTTESAEGKQWQAKWSAALPTHSEIELTVPPGQVFVLGDNRSASTDSRAFGTVPLFDVVGKGRQIWLSLSKDGIRWSRMGKVME